MHTVSFTLFTVCTTLMFGTAKVETPSPPYLVPIRL